MSDIAIKVEGISKKYVIGENKNHPTLRDKLMELPSRLFKGPKKTKEFWALKDVSFEVKKGEVVGIIGRNGAGKSTLLKILARITEPTSGQITMYGRVASMLEVGTGFNPELTGRENIYLNGSIIGMKKSEIEQRFNDIVAFSGVEKFLDTPVKHYSSGMYVRLAFAVAAHLDADILLVDEVLAVGDIEFQKKCLGKMNDIACSGRTVIFVSHNAKAVQDLCSKVLYLVGGKILKYGHTTKVMALYLNNTKIDQNLNVSGPLSKSIIFTQITINDIEKNEIIINPSDSIDVKLIGKALEKIDNIRITLSVYSNDIRIFTMHDVKKGIDLPKATFNSLYHIPGYILRPGTYDIKIGGYQVHTRDWFYTEIAKRFSISSIWSNKNEEPNLGLINIHGDTKRD